MTEKPGRRNRDIAIMKSDQYTKLQEYSPEEQKYWTSMEYRKFGSKMIQRQNPQNQEKLIEYEMSQGW